MGKGDFHVGDTIPFTLKLESASGTLVDPSTVEAVVKGPDYSETTVTMVRLSVGLYEGSFAATLAGPWVISGKCSGGYKGCEPKTVQVYGAFG